MESFNLVVRKIGHKRIEVVGTTMYDYDNAVGHARALNYAHNTDDYGVIVIDPSAFEAVGRQGDR